MKPGRHARQRLGQLILRLLLGLILAPIALGLCGAGFQFVATQLDARQYPPPGQLVDVGGYRLHLYCVGDGSPTVVLNAAFPAQVSNWVWVQSELSQETRVCAYDRAGLGWSDPGPAPRNAQQAARELHALLAKANIPGPYVLVGHSLGGLSVWMFADTYRDQVAGMALIEATYPDVWQRLGLPAGVGVDPGQLALAPVLARLGFFRLGLFPVPKADPDLPPRQRAEEQAFFNSAKYLDSLLATHQAFASALEQVRQTRALGELPLLVVIGSASDNATGVQRQLQDDLARLSTDSVERVIPGATHAGLVDQKDSAALTTAALRELFQAVRSGQPFIGH